MPNIFGIILQYIYHKPTSYIYVTKDYIGRWFIYLVQQNHTRNCIPCW